MKITKSICSVSVLLMLIGVSVHGQTQTGDLLPVPASVVWKTGQLRFDNTLSVALTAHRDARLEAATDRILRRLEGRTSLELKRGFASPENAANAKLIIECKAAGGAVPSLDDDESYSLEVSDSKAVLKSQNVVGAIRGLETLLQLVKNDRDGSFFQAVSIQDKPRFRWRGLLIDSSRHFQPIDVLKRNLDGLAAVKLNVFHWHLTDDQGFRVESKKYPKLHQMGSDGLFYSQEQVRDIISYAAQRGIRVVPEFDMPGHATSWLVGHPELGSAPGPYAIERQPGIMQPTLDPTREEVYALLDGFLGEMAALFPDQYIHIGGDENEGKQWDANPQIQEFKRQNNIKDNHSLQAYFTVRVAKILEKYGKKTMGWDEIMHPDLPKGVVIHSWRGAKSLAEAVKGGYSGVLSAGFYIDLSYPASNHYVNEPVAQAANLSPEEEARILGGEATMWSEYVSTETIDSRIWPRTAAIAERLWSPKSVTDVSDMYRRLAVTSISLEELGLTHERNQRVILRRIASSSSVEPLEKLVSVLEPVKQYTRGRQHPTTMLSPLSSLVDAVRPDSTAAREFSALVDGFLADGPAYGKNRDQLKKTLAAWRETGASVEGMGGEVSKFKGINVLARQMTQLSNVCSEAINYLVEGKRPAQEWIDQTKAVIDGAAKPNSEAVEFAVLPAIRKLVNAAGGS